MALTSSKPLVFAICAALGASMIPVRAGDAAQDPAVVAASPSGEKVKSDVQTNEQDKGNAQNSGDAQKDEMTPEQKMEARFPQPANVGHLVGLPVLDWNDSTIGYVQEVTKTAEGKIRLIVPYGRWFGWANDGSLLAWGRRPVAVPIEVVAILANQIDALEMDREGFEKAPTWVAGQDQMLQPKDIVKIAITRR